MQRRDVLFSAAAASAAAAMAASAAAGVPAPPGRDRGSRATQLAVAPDGAELFVRDVGVGRPVVFLAAWGLTSLAWQYQVAPLAQAGFRCVAYDRRSYGRSSDPGRSYDIDTLADDLATVMETFGLEDAVLVGHSMGAAEIIRYLTRHGAARVRRLVLIAPTTPLLARTADNPEGIDPAIFTLTRTRIAQDFPGNVAANIRPFFVASTSPAMVDWILQMMTAAPLHALLACHEAFTTADFRADLPRIMLPTLVLQGDADMSNPLAISGRKTAALMPNARLHVYQEAPHGLIYTHMERVNSDLRAFASST